MTGAVLAARTPRRSVVLAGVLVTAWVPSVVDLSHSIRLHYSTETFATFVLAPAWVTGLAFCAFAHRRDGAVRNNVLAGLGLGLGIAIFAGAAASSVVYGLGLST